MSKRGQKWVEKIIKDFQKYVASYSEQFLYKTYSDKIIIDDMLYGLGLAFDKEKHQYGDGYTKWKKALLGHLNSGAK